MSLTLPSLNRETPPARCRRGYTGPELPLPCFTLYTVPLPSLWSLTTSALFSSDCCHVPVLVEGHPVSALFDTGSTVTLIHPDLIPPNTQPQRADVPLLTVTGEMAPMLGTCEVTIRSTTRYPVWVAVVGERCLLGLDFLRKGQAHLDLMTGTMVLNEGKVTPLIDEGAT